MTLNEILASLAGSPDVLLSATRDRIGGSRLSALREYLHTYANGVCIVCGLATVLDASPSASNRAEIGHIISASSIDVSASRCGFVPGNVGNMCHACNSAAGEYTFSIDEIIANLVPIEWPILRKQCARIDSHSERAREARHARSLPF